MIQIYKISGSNDLEYALVAEIDPNDGTVTGASHTAEFLRAAFADMRDEGYDPTNHMDSIKRRIDANWPDGYYEVVDNG